MHLVDMDTLTGDAAKLIKALEVASCLFVGNSMGGFVALRLAVRMPELLTGCVVLGTSAKEEHKLEEFAPSVEAVGAYGAEPVIGALMLLLVLTTPVLAQQRSEGRNAEARMFDPSTVEAVGGVITRVDSVDSRRGPSTGIHLQLQTNGDTLAVHLGPSWYMEEQAFAPQVDNSLSVHGLRVTVQGGLLSSLRRCAMASVRCASATLRAACLAWPTTPLSTH